jgi:hypothetical protein
MTIINYPLGCQPAVGSIKADIEAYRGLKILFKTNK